MDEIAEQGRTCYSNLKRLTPSFETKSYFQNIGKGIITIGSVQTNG